MEEEGKKKFAFKKIGELFIKGIPIGMSNTLPGVSGGTMALVLGIYDRLVHSIKNIKFKVLIPILLGAVAGALSSAKLITFVLESYPELMKAFLLGLIFASSGATIKEIKEFNWKIAGLTVVGFAIAYFYSVGVNSTQAMGSISAIKAFFGGVLGSVAMILPGISGGTILVMFGLYEGVIHALSELQMSVLLPLGLGVGVGLLSFSWLLSYLLDNYRSLLMACLTGLILGSMRSVIPAHIGEIVGFGAGFIIIYFLIRSED